MSSLRGLEKAFVCDFNDIEFACENGIVGFVRESDDADSVDASEQPCTCEHICHGCDPSTPQCVCEHICYGCRSE